MTYEFVILQGRDKSVFNTAKLMNRDIITGSVVDDIQIYECIDKEFVDHLININYAQDLDTFMVDFENRRIDISIISEGFHIKSGFHGYFFDYVIRNTKWNLLIRDEEGNPVSSEIPLKSMPFEVKPAFIKVVKSKFSEYPDDIDRLDDILESISVSLNKDQLQNFFDRDVGDDQPCMKYHTITESGSLVFDHEKFGDHLIELMYLKNIITDVRRNYLYFYDNGIYNLRAEHAIGHQFYSDLKGCKPKMGGRKQTEDYCSHEAPVINSDDAVNDNKWFLCFDNCLYDIKNYKKVDFTPDRIFMNRLPIVFDEKVECPVFSAMMERVFPDDHVSIDTLQELFGYVFYPDYHIQVAFMLVGEGANGKGVITNTISKMIGMQNYRNLKPQILADRFNAGELYNKMLNLCNEIPVDSMVSTDIFKLLVSKDPITSDRKHMSPITFINRAKMIFSANKIPITYDESAGFYRRWVVLKFHEKFTTDDPDFDPNIDEKISTPDELSGIFNWAMVGLRRLLTNNDFTCNLGMTFNEKIDRNKKDMNFAHYFVSKFTAACEHKGVNLVDLYLFYKERADKQGVIKVLSKYKFDQYMVNSGHVIVTNGRGRPKYWDNLEIINIYAEPIPEMFEDMSDYIK